jgi:hypothetical protein
VGAGGTAAVVEGAVIVIAAVFVLMLGDVFVFMNVGGAVGVSVGVVVGDLAVAVLVFAVMFVLMIVAAAVGVRMRMGVGLLRISVARRMHVRGAVGMDVIIRVVAIDFLSFDPGFAGAAAASRTHRSSPEFKQPGSKTYSTYSTSSSRIRISVPLTGLTG